jgi:hypothetical protein
MIRTRDPNTALENKSPDFLTFVPRLKRADKNRVIVRSFWGK